MTISHSDFIRNNSFMNKIKVNVNVLSFVMVFGIFANSLAPWLSSEIVVGSSICLPRSFIKRRSHTASCLAELKTMYSA